MEFKEILTKQRKKTWDVITVDKEITDKMPVLMQLIDIEKVMNVLNHMPKVMPKFLETMKVLVSYLK